MNCPKCGSKNNDRLSFCEDCGATLKQTTNTAKAPAAQMSLAELDLLTWKPFRWLFKTNYGKLTISDDHINFTLNPSWSIPALRILVKLFNWGFDWLSMFRNSGHSQLKNLNTSSLIKLNWIVWDIHILVITSAGYWGFYPVSADQKVAVEAFINSLKPAANNAKYRVEK